MRDLLAEKRDRVKRVVEMLYDEEMAPVLKGLYDLQSRCKHPNNVVKDDKKGHSERCPDCDRFICWGPAPTYNVNEYTEIKKDVREFLKHKNLL
jgi:hypothetical protein